MEREAILELELRGPSDIGCKAPSSQECRLSPPHRDPKSEQQSLEDESV